MAKATLDRLDQKLDDMKDILCDMKDEVHRNTKFRHEAKGIIGFVSFLCTGVGAGIFWVIDKLGGK